MAILQDYEKDIFARIGLTQKDLLFMEPEDISAEVKHRIEVARCAEIRGLLQLTSLKGITQPNAEILYAAGVTTRWDLLTMDADAIVAKVNAKGKITWGDKERKKLEKVLADNAELLEEI